jgi:hypothetical protein
MMIPKFEAPTVTADDLALMGEARTVYIREMDANEIETLDELPAEAKRIGVKLYSVHANDGTRMAILDDRDAAFAAARQYEMEPVSVH